MPREVSCMELSCGAVCEVFCGVVSKQPCLLPCTRGGSYSGTIYKKNRYEQQTTESNYIGSVGAVISKTIYGTAKNKIYLSCQLETYWYGPSALL